MGKRIRAQRKGSSPRFKVSSHRFPGANRMPNIKEGVGEVVELIHSPVHHPHPSTTDFTCSGQTLDTKASTCIGLRLLGSAACPLAAEMRPSTTDSTCFGLRVVVLDTV